MTSQSGLLRVLGLVFGLAAVVGSVVGQGILRSPGTVALASEDQWVLIALWLAGSAIALVSAAPFAELSAAIPSAGGLMAFVERAFGRRTGIVAAMILIVANVASTAMLAFVCGEFLVRLGVGEGRLSPATLAFLALCLFAAVNAAGTRFGGAAQIVLSGAKGFMLMALVVVLFAHPGAAPAPSIESIHPGSWAAFGTAILLIIGTYNGWADLVVYGEEIANPGKSIPRAMFGGIIGVTALYLLVNLAIFHVMSPSQIAGSEFAAADAAERVFGARGNIALTVFGVLSVAAITNLAVMTTTRIVFAAARDGILPRQLAGVAGNGTPMAAMLVTVAASMLFLLSGTYLALSSTSVAMVQSLYVATILAMWALRRKEPGLARPYRVPLHPWLPLTALTINAVLLAVFAIQDPWNALIGFALVAGMAGVYFLTAGRGAQPAAPIAGEPAE